MSLAVDEIVDRRKLRRKVSFWRVVAFLLLAAALVAISFASGIHRPFSKTAQPHIAKIKIEGVIVNDEPMLELLAKLKENENVHAVILEISSPGGSTVGGEAHYEAVRSLAEKKPVVTNVGTLAASAGYMIASATDHIVARRSSIVGSIGVLFQYADVSGLLEKIGVKIDAVKSSPLKAEPSPFHPASPEALEMIDRVISDSYDWFVDLVAERRNMTVPEVQQVADGSIYTGTEGLKNGLVDSIGGEEAARKWLEEEKNIGADLKVVEWKPERPTEGIFTESASLHLIARLLGIEPSAGATKAIESYLKERVLLDGLVSIWQGRKK